MEMAKKRKQDRNPLTAQGADLRRLVVPWVETGGAPPQPTEEQSEWARAVVSTLTRKRGRPSSGLTHMVRVRCTPALADAMARRAAEMGVSEAEVWRHAAVLLLSRREDLPDYPRSKARHRSDR